MYTIVNEYLIISRNVLENLLLYSLKNIEKDTIESLRVMCLKLVAFEREEIKEHVSQIAIKKESILAKWIIDELNAEMKKRDTEISYDKIVNAILISMHQDDYKTSNKIIPLFQNNLSGSREELLNQGYDEKVLNYICTNADFEVYLERINKKTAVYESEKWTLRGLVESSRKIRNHNHEISYDKIVNAILITMHQDDYKISNKIMSLFQNNLSGSREELLNQGYGANVLDYICANADFEAYLKRINNKNKKRSLKKLDSN